MGRSRWWPGPGSCAESRVSERAARAPVQSGVEGPMQARIRYAFLALVVAQAAHSIEEYHFALYEVFAPARFASSLVSSNPALGFAVLNAALVALGAWCYLWRVRPGHPSAPAWIWPWVLVELANGVVHPTAGLLRGAYFPGMATAPVLFVLAAYLGVQLLRVRPSPRRSAA